MFESVTVIAPARLHLGFLDLNGGLGRRFGSIGLAIDRPRTRLTLRRAARLSVEGKDSERAAAHLAVLTERLGLPSTYRLSIEEAIPDHVGLGSGTQLALALAHALRRLEGLGPDMAADTALLQRTKRSGVGAAVFEHGGVIVDGGRGERTVTPPILARLDLPQAWRILVVQDPEVKGLYGARETQSFAALGPLDAASAAEICRLVLIQALPAVAEKDLAAFGAAISRIQQIVGAYFAPVQGGEAYTSATVGEALAELQRQGATGVGQSSWGPTGFAFAQSVEEAERLRDVLRTKNSALGLDITICKGLNQGAVVTAT